MDNNEPKPSPYQGVLKTVRMIVLLECQPLSNEYHQMVFTEEQYDAISRFIQSSFPEGPSKAMYEGQGGRAIKFTEPHHPLAPEIEPFYPDDQEGSVSKHGS